MGTYTYTLFKSYLKLRCGSNSAFDDYYGVWVNSAYSFLTTSETIGGVRKRMYFPELEVNDTVTTSNGFAVVSPPTDCLITREIYDSTNTRRLDWIPLSEYVNKTDRADTSAEGQPQKWTRMGSYYYLWPTPDATYSLLVYYKKRPTALSGASDVTAIGKEWDDIILELATSIARNWMISSY